MLRHTRAWWTNSLKKSKSNVDGGKIDYGVMIGRQFIRQFSELVDQTICKKRLRQGGSLKTLLRQRALQRRSIVKRNPSIVCTRKHCSWNRSGTSSSMSPWTMRRLMQCSKRCQRAVSKSWVTMDQRHLSNAMTIAVPWKTLTCNQSIRWLHEGNTWVIAWWSSAFTWASQQWRQMIAALISINCYD